MGRTSTHYTRMHGVTILTMSNWCWNRRVQKSIANYLLSTLSYKSGKQSWRLDITSQSFYGPGQFFLFPFLVYFWSRYKVSYHGEGKYLRGTKTNSRNQNQDVDAVFPPDPRLRSASYEYICHNAPGASPWYICLCMLMLVWRCLDIRIQLKHSRLIHLWPAPWNARLNFSFGSMFKAINVRGENISFVIHTFSKHRTIGGYVCRSLVSKIFHDSLCRLVLVSLGHGSSHRSRPSCNHPDVYNLRVWPQGPGTGPVMRTARPDSCHSLELVSSSSHVIPQVDFQGIYRICSKTSFVKHYVSDKCLSNIIEKSGHELW